MKNDFELTALALGNKAFRNREYRKAILHYENGIIEQPALKDVIEFNLALSLQRVKIEANNVFNVHNNVEIEANSESRTGIVPSTLFEKVFSSPEHEIIAASGKFDSRYYLDTYTDVASSGIDPIEHYCYHGWIENRNPNQEFNTHYYLGKNPDVAEAGINPFSHWIKYGQYEQRKTLVIDVDPKSKIRKRSPSIIFVSHEASQTGAPAVLITLMRWIKANTAIDFSIMIGAKGEWNRKFEDLAPCFYFDGNHKRGLSAAIRDFCGSNVKTVYVNTIASGHYAEHLKYLEAEFITHVHEMENVFRIYESNFEALARLCSKFIAVSQGSVEALQTRSNGRFEISFLKPFIEPRMSRYTEIRSAERTKIIFGCGAVETRKGFDLFCDVGALLKASSVLNFKMYWIGSGIGKDLDPAHEIKRRNLGGVVEWLGPKENPREYFEAGDLFLLPSREDPYPLVCLEAADCGLPIICFDQEAGGMHSFVENDAGIVVPYLDVRAMAGAVSRVLRNLRDAKSLGNNAQRKVAERHYVDQVAPKILDLLPEEIYKQESGLNAYYALIDEAAIVSFDIFDTLVTRQISEPEVVFDLIEHKYSQVEPVSVSMLNERMQTAGKVLGDRLGDVDDVGIDDIYKEMGLYRSAIIEKDTEIEVCIAHPNGKALYEYAVNAGKTIYIASDMYLDETTIKQILMNNGYTKWDQLYLSSSLGKKKDTGRLYLELKKCAEKDGVSCESILHVGDSWEGDVRHAKLAGLKTKRFTPISESSQKIFTLSLVQKNLLSQNGRIWNSFCEQQSNLWSEASPQLAADFYTALGFEVTGPLASMMAIHVKTQAQKAGISTIVFMARDGRVIKKAFDILYADAIEAGLFDSKYLHLSRATVVPATFQHPLTSNDISFILDGLHLAEKSVGFFLEKAGLDPNNETVRAAIDNIMPDVSEKPEWKDFSKMSRLLDALSGQIHDANASARLHLKNYLSQHEILTSDAIMLVDVGWMLNIHARVEGFIQALGLSTKVDGCYVGSRERAKKFLPHSGLLFEYGDPFRDAKLIESNTTLFEVLFSAPEPTAKGFKDGGPLGSIIEYNALEVPLPAEFLVAQKLHMGAECFFHKLSAARKSFFPEAISRDYFGSLFQCVVDSQDPTALANLGHFEVRLGGHHEFVTHQCLIQSEKPHIDYRLKARYEFFDPITTIASPSTLSVLIITSAGLDNGSTRYRTLHLAHSLSSRGISSTALHASTNLDVATALIADADSIIFQRCFPSQGNVGAFYSIARNLGKRCILEIDDLVFPKYVSTIGSVVGGEWGLDEALSVAMAYEEFIKKMDAAITSTPELMNHINSAYKLPCSLYRNKVSCVSRNNKVSTDQQLKLIYASGTYSHKEDFTLIESVIYHFLTDFPTCTLSILGAAQVSERILALPNVSSYPILEYGDMLRFIANHDLMLVPLVNNIFNRAKSNIKFVESGSVGVPVLASKVGEFKAAISHNKNGFLASSPHEWREVLELIVKDPRRIRIVGKQAAKLVEDKYITSLCELDPAFLRGKPSQMHGKLTHGKAR